MMASSRLRSWFVAAAMSTAFTQTGPPASAVPVRKLDLSQVMAAARTNPAVKVARAGTKTAHARVAEVRGRRYPRIELTSFVAPSPGIECENADCTRTSPEQPTVSLAGVFSGLEFSLAQPVYTFGKLGAGIDAALAGETVAEMLERNKERTVTVEAARSYYELKYARELVILLEDGLEDIDKVVGKVQDKLSAGSGEVTVQDRLRLETLRADVKARLADAGGGEATALAALRGLVGDDEMDIDDAPLEPVEYSLEPAADAYTEKARASEPRLGAVRAAKAGAAALATLERRRFLPDILVVGGVSVARAQGVDNPRSAFADDPFNTTSARVALLLRWTLDPVAQKARVSRADADVDKAVSAERVVERVVAFELQRAYNDAASSQARMQAMKDGDKSSRAWVAAELQADVVGTGTARDLADAYRSHFTIRARYLQSIRDWNVATVTLDAATGELGSED